MHRKKENLHKNLFETFCHRLIIDENLDYLFIIYLHDEITV